MTLLFNFYCYFAELSLLNNFPGLLAISKKKQEQNGHQQCNSCRN